MSTRNGSAMRSETDRLLGRPVKLFTVTLMDGEKRTEKEIKVPVLPASQAMEWLKLYTAALDKQAHLSRVTSYYETKAIGDWGTKDDEYLTREDWEPAYQNLIQTTFAAFSDAFYGYGDVCAAKLDIENPLDRDLLEPVITSEQQMNGLSLLRECNDPLRCLESSLAMREKDRVQLISS